jgi:UDP-N-acetylglucosamine--N-acetylmuramyl-(pentapeptide) pyrophosphoryl-undecaprenol N-acetylglucosamine transferase
MVRDLVTGADVRFDRFDEVMAGPLHGVPLGQKIASAFKLLVGMIQALILVLRTRPQALFLTGGWVGFPVAAAGWLLRCPIVIYVPDIEPGLALKVLGRMASLIAATVPDTAAYFPGKRVVVTGYPLRPALLDATREEGLRLFGLDPARRTLLVFGGSRGARSLNTAIGEIAPALLAEGVQILHITGKLDWQQVEARHAALDAAQRAFYQIFPYRSDIGYAFAAADLVVSRAGASSLAEYPQHSLPAILVPYPYAWRYQKVNADYLAAHGAGIRLEDERLGDDLLPLLRDLFNDPARLGAMREAMAALKRSDGADAIARLVLDQARA